MEKEMEKTQKEVPNFESVWAILQETAQLQKESRAEIKESRAEMKESRAEFDRRLEESRAAFEKSRAEFDRSLEESRAEMKESRADYERRMKKMEELMGSWSNNHGQFAEEYFINSFENGRQNFFGEKFDEIEKNVKGIKPGFKDEYDILLINGKTVGIVEVKFKAHENDIPEILEKADTFRINFPDYKNHKAYLGLATLAFYPSLEQKCIDNGIAIIKQVGDMVVINDKHLKVF